SYKANRAAFIGARDSVSLIVDLGSGFDFVKSEAEAGKINALKIHSRVQKIGAADYDRVKQKLSLLPEPLPIIIDAFYYGKDMEHQPNLNAIVDLMSTFE